MKYKNILTKKFLEQKYLVEKLSMAQIAKLVGSNATTLLNYLKKYNISRRTTLETMKGKYGGENNPMYGKHHTKETKKKISETRKRLGLSKNENNSMYGVHRFGGESPYWKGGKYKDKDGYVLILFSEHPYNNNSGYVREHRLVVENVLGQYLNPKWVVHHKNGIREDNRIENLMCFVSNSAHARFHKNPKLAKSNEIIFDGGTLG